MPSNDAYSTTEFINSILSFSFKDRQYVSRANLNRISYIIAEEYYNATGKNIISERFDFSTLTPSLRTIQNNFNRCFEFSSIEHYIKDNEGPAKTINDPTFLNIAKKVWKETKSMPLTEITNKVIDYRRNDMAMAS